jgi:hypothetical protein
MQMGYGARALQVLNAYYSGEYFNLDETAKVDVSYSDIVTINEVCQNLAAISRGSLPFISRPRFSLTILLSDQSLLCLPYCKDSQSVNLRTSITSVCHTG